jgi:hypothetical protein
MRPIVIERRPLRATQQDLESAAEDIATAVARVDPPADDYPWHRLVDEGVQVLLADARQLSRACRRVAEGIADSVADFDGLDAHVALAAEVDAVSPTDIGRPPAGPR